MTRRMASLCHDRAHLGLEDISGREEQRGIEVSLHGIPPAETLERVGEGHPVVHTDDLGTGLPHEGEQFAGADAEVDAWHAEVGDR